MKVFISHSSNDKRFVGTLKDDLNENGIETFFDEDSLELGDSLKERLDIALDESSHFSPNAVSSNWVRYELLGAVNLFGANTLKKIIPIKYRECEIPESIAGLLYADLSGENVKRNEEYVKFIGDGYDRFLNKLLTTLKNSDKRLNKSDRTELKKEATQTEKNNEKELSATFRIKHKIVRYKDMRAIDYYRGIVSKNKRVKSLKDIQPIILPPY